MEIWQLHHHHISGLYQREMLQILSSPSLPFYKFDAISTQGREIKSHSMHLRSLNSVEFALKNRQKLPKI